jgi:hypothetical protein
MSLPHAHTRPAPPTRRAFLTALGLSSAGLARLRASAPSGPPRHRGNSCVFLFLFGGPSQIDLWDMKPDAPDRVRGEFDPIATRAPGVHVCEHLPRLSAVMNEVCLVRSMTHRMNVHGPACSEVLTGDEVRAAARAAGEPVGRGFDAYAEAWRESRIARQDASRP